MNRYYTEERYVLDSELPLGKEGSDITHRFIARCIDVKTAEKITNFLNSEDQK